MKQNNHYATEPLHNYYLFYHTLASQAESSALQPTLQNLSDVRVSKAPNCFPKSGGLNCVTTDGAHLDATRGHHGSLAKLYTFIHCTVLQIRTITASCTFVHS